MKRNTIITGLLAAGLLVSLVLNVALFLQGQKYYLTLNHTRLHPLGLNAYPTTSSEIVPLDPDKPLVVFYGDSRAAQWPTPDDMPQYQFLNRGIGAQTSTQIRLRQAAHLNPLQADILVLQLCANDLKTIPLFPEDKTEIITTCQQNIGAIVAQAQAAGTTAILTTVFPLGQVPLERRPFWSPEVALAIDEVNLYIDSLESDSVIIFDTASALAEDGPVKDEYAFDLLHLNEQGYQALNEVLRQILLSIEA